MTDAWTEPADVVEGDDITPAHTDDAAPTDDITPTDDISPDEAEDGIPDEPEVFVEELQADELQADEPQIDDVGAAADLPETGDPRVDDVLGKLAGIEHRPTGEHVGVYDEVHRGLQDALANLDQG